MSSQKELAFTALEQLYFFVCPADPDNTQEPSQAAQPGELSLTRDPFTPIVFTAADLENREAFKRALGTKLFRSPVKNIPKDTEVTQLCDRLWFRSHPDEAPSQLSRHWDRFLGFINEDLLKFVRQFEAQQDTASDDTIRAFLRKVFSPPQGTMAYRVIPVNKNGPVDRKQDITSEDNRANSHASMSNYVLQLQSHVQAGSRARAGCRFFISATSDLNTALWYSKAGMLTVVYIKLSECDLKIDVGANNGMFSAVMAKNYAKASSEIIVDSVIPADAYVKVQFTKKNILRRFDLDQESRTLPNFDPSTFSPIQELKGTTRPIKVKGERGHHYVIKLGPHFQDHQQNFLHLLDEFFASVVYSCAGALVPPCSLQLVELEVNPGFGAPKQRQEIWVLISKFIQGDNLKSKDVTKDVVLHSQLGKHVMVDLLLHNMDAMGPDYRNVILIHGEGTSATQAYRVDCGACWGNSPTLVPKKTDRASAPGAIEQTISSKANAAKAKPGDAYNCLSRVLGHVRKSEKIARLQELGNSLLKTLRGRMAEFRLYDSRFLERRSYLEEALPKWLQEYSAGPQVPPLHPAVSGSSESSSRKGKRKVAQEDSDNEDNLTSQSVPPSPKKARVASGTQQASSSGSSSNANRSGVAVTVTPAKTAPAQRKPAKKSGDQILIKGVRSKQHPQGYTVLDLTSGSKDEFVRFSPFFVHGGIPVPYVPGSVSGTVEGVWQGLKVFANEGVDTSKFLGRQGDVRKDLKRGKSGKRGEVIGHHGGGKIDGSGDQTLLSYVEARHQIYIPTYRWVLKNRLQREVEGLLERLRRGEKFVFLDYFVNEDATDPKNRLSHAGVLKKYLLEKLDAEE